MINVLAPPTVSKPQRSRHQPDKVDGAAITIVPAKAGCDGTPMIGQTSAISSAARRYHDAGLCVLPARRAEKRPAVGAWKQYQKRLPTAPELDAWLANNPDAICILCGAVSNHAEMIDFDGNDELFWRWWERIPAHIRDRLVVETTPAGGLHVIYLCLVAICGNLKLAQRKVDGKIITLIETRGEGGLFLCAPTPGYALIQGDFTNLPTLTAAERDILLQAAWELNEYVPPVVDGPRGASTMVNVGQMSASSATMSELSAENDPMCDGAADNGRGANHHAERPGDDFNHRGDPRKLLEQHGWVCAGGSGDNEYWRRPGKDSGWSATLKDGVFYVFSSNAAPFEPNRAYSPFSVLTLLEHGGDFEQAARTLRSSGYGGDPLPETLAGVDISGIMQMSVAPGAGVSHNPHSGECEADDPNSPRARPTSADPGPIPAGMLRVPGFIGEVMDHCLATAPYPNQVMAFAGALSLQAFLAGRKVRDGGDNRTNIYLLGLAHSASGKDWPRKINTRILHEVGLADALGERFASGEGIQDALFQTPSMLFQTDEIDGMLQSINKARDARHEAIMSTLLTMHSCSNSVFPMRRRAGKDSPGVIDQPCLTIFGTAIPNHYYEALSERMLTNGFFARMIILEAGQRGRGQEPSIGDLPERVVTTAGWWAQYRPGDGNLQNWHPVPAIVAHTEQARCLLVETREEAEGEYAAAEASGDSVGTTVWGRVSEQMRKLAMLYAISENHRSPRIGIEAVRWASRFAMHQTRRMLFMAQAHVAENDFEVLIKRAVGILRQWHEKHGPDVLMPAWDLRRRLKQRPNDFKDIVLELDARQIARLDTEKASTKPKSGYRLL